MTDGKVVPLRRAPVRQATTVRSDVRHTFDVFVRTIGVWWPVSPFSSGGERVRDVTVERRVGGRVYETWHDGTVAVWGELLAWDPPHTFRMTWLHTPKPTEVALIFTELGPKLTRVAVEHHGWDAMTDEELARDCALPGGYGSGAYSVGWARILACLVTAVES